MESQFSEGWPKNDLERRFANFCKNTILNEIYFFRWMTRQSFLSEKQIDLVFQKFDIDGDGSLSFREFKK